MCFFQIVGTEMDASHRFMEPEQVCKQVGVGSDGLQTISIAKKYLLQIFFCVT